MRIIDVTSRKSFFPPDPSGKYIDAYRLRTSQIDDRLEGLSREIWKKFGHRIQAPSRWPRLVLRISRWAYILVFFVVLTLAILFSPDGSTSTSRADDSGWAAWAFVTMVTVALSVIVLSWIARRQLKRSYNAAPMAVSEERASEGRGLRTVAKRLFWLTGISFVGLLAVVVGGVTTGVTTTIDGSGSYALGVGLAIVALVVSAIASVFFSIRFYFRSQALLQPTAKEAREADPRNPVLFLRSFGDDDLGIRSDGDYYGFEEAISDQMRPFGPLIAIGRPGEPLPSLGASRDYYSDDEWKQKVSNWMDEAFAMLIVPGVTQGLGWELETIETRGHVPKLLVLMPPADEVRLEPNDIVTTEAHGMRVGLEWDPVTEQTKVARQVRKRDNADSDLQTTRLARWAMARNSLIDVAGYSTLPEQPPEKLIAVHLGADGQPTYITGNPTETDYETAIRTAFFGMFCHKAGC